MRRFAKTLAGIASRLKAEGEFDFEHRVPEYQKALGHEQKWHAMQSVNFTGLQMGRRRAEMLDDFLTHLMDEAAARVKKPPKMALIALGGYGRSELNPKSDADITWMYDGGARLPAGFAEIVKEVYDLIMACDFDPGHSTRSLAETLAEANKEMKSRTAMLEARFLWGDEALFAKFQTQFFGKCVKPYIDEYLAARVKDMQERHSTTGECVNMQQPNLKSGSGGLRDYQNLLWMAYFQRAKTHDGKKLTHERVTTAHLVEWKFLNESERRELDRAYEFIFRLRTELHLLTGLHTDVVFVNQQRDLADRLGYKEKFPDVLERTEALMRDYYEHAMVIFELTELVAGRMALPMPEAPKPRGFIKTILNPFRRRKAAVREEFDGFIVQDGRIHYADRQIFKEDKGRMMRLFRHVQKRGLAMTPELRQLVRRRLKYVDATFRYAKAHREVFMDILRQKGRVGVVLRAMHRTGFLGKYMPEFGLLTALVQHEHYHRYTVDEHTLVCIEKLDALLDTDDERQSQNKELFQKLDDPFILYLALILHDTGKAANRKSHLTASAINAQAASRRLQLTAEQRQMLIFLVDSHDLLSKVARKCDPQDAEVVAETALVVGTQQRLDMLLLITVADGMGVGDGKMWNDWTESLVRMLYRGILHYLADSEGFRSKRRVEREEMHAAVAGELPEDFADEIGAHFSGMPDRYFLVHGPGRESEVVEHLKMFREFFAERWALDDAVLKPVVRWVPHKNSGHSELWVVTWDRPQLLARIAGAISAAELGILGADIFTRGDGLVLDKFRVTTARYESVEDKRDQRKVEKLLTEALAVEKHDFSPAIAAAYRHMWKREQPAVFEPRVYYDNSHAIHALVEITAPDRIGLLYDLLETISVSGYEIVSARITTEKGAAIDAFHLTGPKGAKIPNDGRLDALRHALKVVAARPPIA